MLRRRLFGNKVSIENACTIMKLVLEIFFISWSFIRDSNERVTPTFFFKSNSTWSCYCCSGTHIILIKNMYFLQNCPILCSFYLIVKEMLFDLSPEKMDGKHTMFCCNECKPQYNLLRFDADASDVQFGVSWLMTYLLYAPGQHLTKESC